MLNIPTELLRTLVSVVDQRSFTKAAQSLGVTQPAVSAQIKRLQFLLGYEILDKSAPGVSLTPRGEMVVAHARRMLSINDQIAQLQRPASRRRRRCASPSPAISPASRFRRRWRSSASAGRTFVSSSTATSFENMLRGLRQGDLDLAVAVANSKPSIEAHHLWIDQAVWVRSDATQLDPQRAGAAGVVRRGLLVPLHGGERAASRRARLRLRVHLAQHRQPGGRGRRRARRHGAAAQPRLADLALDLGGRAASGTAASSIAGSTCARAATGRRSRNSPMRSRRCCARSSR